MSRKFYLICGERSGDLHSSNLVRALKQQDPTVQLRGVGGEQSQAAGLELFSHYKEIAFMGFLEVFLNIFTIIKRMNAVKADILKYQPEAVILVDFSGFNMKIAAFCKEHNIKVNYYISPKIWAWNTGRANKIKKLVDNMLVILPFEEEFYRQFDFKVHYVGNPLRDAIDAFTPNPDFKKQYNLPEDKPIIAILPGSRFQEVSVLLQYITQVVPEFPQAHFVIAGVSNLDESMYKHYVKDNVSFIVDDTYNLLTVARAAVVASGTATLETALFKVPQVVVYKLSSISYFIGKLVIKVKYISLVNLIADKLVVQELIQKTFTKEHLEQELKKILPDGADRSKMMEGYDYVSGRIGERGVSANAAKLILG